VNGVRDRRQRDSGTMERAASGVVAASSRVISAIKAIDRAKTVSDQSLDRLDDAIDQLASAHASLVLAVGHPGPEERKPSTAADWSRSLSRGSRALADSLRDPSSRFVALRNPAGIDQLKQSSSTPVWTRICLPAEKRPTSSVQSESALSLLRELQSQMADRAGPPQVPRNRRRALIPDESVRACGRRAASARVSPAPRRERPARARDSLRAWRDRRP
jgi:hypothetical protein